MAEYRPADTLTRMLKQKGSKLSAVAANKKLLAAGVLEEKTRPSSTRPGVLKKFKSLTEQGLRFGENVPNERAEGQTSPHYFFDTFDELYREYIQGD